MITFKKIIFSFFLAITFTPHTTWTAEAAVLEEGIESSVSRGVDAALEEGLGGEIGGAERALTEQETSYLSRQITESLDALGASGEKITAEEAGAVAQKTTESILQKMQDGQAFSTQVEGSAVRNTVEDAQTFFKNNPEELQAYVSDLQKAGGDSASVFQDTVSQQEIETTIKSATSSLTEGSAGSATAESIKSSVPAVEEDATEVPFQEKPGWVKSLFSTPKRYIVEGYDTLTGTVERLRVKLGASASALVEQVATRESFIAAKADGTVADAADGSGLKVMKVKGYDGEIVNVKGGAGEVKTSYDSTTKEYTVTRGTKTVNISAESNPVLKSATIKPEDVKFQVDAEGNLQWRFDPKDEGLFNIKSVEGLDGEVTQTTKSFENLSSSVNKETVAAQKTAVEEAKASLDKVWSKTKVVAKAGFKQVWQGAKWVSGYISKALDTVVHGLMQAVIFTVPNILEQNRVQAAQMAEQYAQLTSVQKFGNLTLQIPAFLIPKGSPMNGLFIYMQVPQNAPAGVPNNFDEGTLLNGDYFVSVGDAYTPWGSTYIPQTGKLIHLNTGFMFGASGTASGATEFVPLMSDKNATVDGNVGAGPVVRYLQTVLGKGVGGQTAGQAHVSSWKDWLPFGKVKTAAATVQSSAALAFLFDAPQDGEEILPPAMITRGLAQFLKETAAGNGPCSLVAQTSSEAAGARCMTRGLNGLPIRQAMGIGFVAGALETLSKPGVVDIATIKQDVNTVLLAQQDLLNVILNHAIAKGAATMADAQERQKLITNKLDALRLANQALTTYGSEGVSPELCINALGIYVYETVDTPIASFMIKHSPLAVANIRAGQTPKVTEELLKDYVVLLDSDQTIVPAYNAQVTEKGEVRYVPNNDVMYLCSLVSGRTYTLGAGAVLSPKLDSNKSVTGIATNVWAALTNQLQALDNTSGAGDKGAGAALIKQITAMTNYATNLIVEGPYTKGGYTFEKVDLELTPTDEEAALTLTFDQLASGATVASSKTVATPFSVKQKFIGSGGNGVLMYRAIGALGVDEAGKPIDDYVVALGETQVTLSSGGSRPAFIMMPLATDAFVNELSAGSGITALVSLITGKVYTSDYVPQPPTRRMNVLMRNNNMSLISDPNSAVSVNNTPVGSVNLPMATAYMPTDLNPYNIIPKNPSDYATMTQLQQALGAAVVAYAAVPVDTQNREKTPQGIALTAATAAVNNFNEKIAQGTIPVEPRVIGNNLGDMLYVENMYWAMYQGYNVCTSATLGTAQGSALPWVTGMACTSNNQLEIANGGTAASLISILPTKTAQLLNDTFNRWFKEAATSGAVAQFEEGPFNVVNGLYLTLGASDARRENYFYQALPSFDSRDLMVVASLKGQVDPTKPEYSVADFSGIGSSYPQATNPVLIDIRNGYVLIPTNPAASCTLQPGFLCNLVTINNNFPRVYDIAPIIDAALAQQGTSLATLQTTNPSLAGRLQYALYQNDVRLQQQLTQNYFAGRQLLLNPDAISSYVYAVATLAPGSSVGDAWDTATDYWVCGQISSSGGQPTVSQTPLNAATPCMISLVTGNVYYQSSTLSITTIASGNSATAVSSYLLGQLKNVPTLLTGGRLQTLATLYQTSQESTEEAEPNLALPASFFTSLTQVSSTQFQNLYTNGKEYFLQASITPIVADPKTNQIAPAAQESVTWFAFNQPNATSDTGIGYYYPVPANATSSTSLTPQSGMREFNLQAMRAHYGVSVASNGAQSLVLPMSSLPLPMNVADKKLAAGTSGTYMQYLGSLPAANNNQETDYYYQNTLANNFLMRRVSTSPLSSFAQTTAKTNKQSITSDYYVDLVSGDEFNLDGSPRLRQATVAYTTAGSGKNTYLNMTNPLFAWSEYDSTTEMPTYHAMFQPFGTTGYQLLSPEAYGISYDIQMGGSVTRYSYQPSADGTTIAITAAPVTNGQAGNASIIGQLLDANGQPTGMKTALASAFSKQGILVAINTTCVDGTVISQVPSVPSMYTVVPGDGSPTLIYTQALPGITATTLPQTTNISKNAAYLTPQQVQTFLAGIPFVATITGNIVAGSNTTGSTAIAAPTSATSQDYYVCGLMTPQKALLSVVTSYPVTANTPTAGRFYFIATNEDSNASNTVWNAPQPGQYYPNNYSLLTPLVDPTQTSLNLSAPTVQAGIFDYTAIAAQTQPVSTDNAVIPAANWGKGAYYLVVTPQQTSESFSNVSITGIAPKVFNFMYNNVARDDLPSINNGVQVVATLQGVSQLAAPLSSAGLQGQSVATNNANVYFYPGQGLIKPCSLYQIAGTETDSTKQLAFFNQPAPTQPQVAPGTYVDLLTGTMYIPVGGMLYPLSYGAPYGTREFLYPFLQIHGVDPKTGKVLNNQAATN